MAFSIKCTIFALALLAGPVSASNMDPIAKVLMMLEDLQVKVKKAGEAEDKAFKEFFDWCDDAASDAKHSIKDSTKAKEKAEATISKMTADIEDADTSIAE